LKYFLLGNYINDQSDFEFYGETSIPPENIAPFKIWIDTFFFQFGSIRNCEIWLLQLGQNRTSKKNIIIAPCTVVPESSRVIFLSRVISLQWYFLVICRFDISQWIWTQTITENATVMLLTIDVTGNKNNYMYDDIYMISMSLYSIITVWSLCSWTDSDTQACSAHDQILKWSRSLINNITLNGLQISLKAGILILTSDYSVYPMKIYQKCLWWDGRSTGDA
jgi:hypothetical protein